MARRTRLYKKIPWNGGLNDAVDPGVLNDNDLTIADNVIFTTSGSRLKREGIEYLDTAVPAVTHKESSGTTRTLYFQNLQETSPTDKKLVVGETITITGDANYSATAVKVVSVTNVSGTEWSITYTAAGSLTESKTATSAITVTKAHNVLDILDYWYLDSSFVKQQLLLETTSDGKIFAYGADLGRDEIVGETESFTVQIDKTGLATTGAGDYWTFQTISSTGTTTSYYVWYNDTSGSNTDPAVSGTGVQIDWDSAVDTNDDVASATQAAIDALSDVSASVSTDTVTITLDNAGDVTAASDENTGFTITLVTSGATVASNAEKVNSIVMNNRAVIAFDTIGDKPIKYFPEDSTKYQLLGGDPQDFSLMVEHQGRMWTNDKTNPDRVHYSTTGNIEEWGGTGDSGAIDVGTGDGDAEGITALFVYKGILLVAKRDKLYRIDGSTPSTYAVIKISNGIGVVNHKAVAQIDQDDVIFVSRRGIHSLAATDTYGDIESQYVSLKIQNTFNSFNALQLDKANAVYINTLNSVAFSFPERSRNESNDLYLFNIALKEWYKWPSISCVTITTRIANNNVRKLVTGTTTGRLIQAQRGTFTDFTDTATKYMIKTGTIYPEGDIQSIKGFKKLSLLYKPKGDFIFTVKVKIDNYAPQILTFQQESVGDELGTNFVLGQSVLGVDNTFAPFTQPIEGYGRGLTLEIVQTGTDEQVEIYGFIIEYDIADIQQQTLEG